jgi:hypothetical protein
MDAVRDKIDALRNELDALINTATGPYEPQADEWHLEYEALHLAIDDMESLWGQLCRIDQLVRID